jgi:hypothetical protein
VNPRSDRFIDQRGELVAEFTQAERLRFWFALVHNFPFGWVDRFGLPAFGGLRISTAYSASPRRYVMPQSGSVRLVLPANVRFTPETRHRSCAHVPAIGNDRLGSSPIQFIALISQCLILIKAPPDALWLKYPLSPVLFLLGTRVRKMEIVT